MSGKLLKMMFLRAPILFLACVTGHIAPAAETQNMPKPAARDIPGIIGEDPFPLGCVSCHINMPDKNKDARISTLMKQLTEQVAPGLLEKAQAASPSGISLKGKHPVSENALANIPASCLECHGRSTQNAPFFAQMLHLIHLTGGSGNHFVSLFQGECTYCHKLDAQSGVWSIPSGRETP